MPNDVKEIPPSADREVERNFAAPVSKSTETLDIELDFLLQHKKLLLAW